MYWTRKEFMERKRQFLADCEPHHGGLMFWHLWLISTVTWLSGWGISALLKFNGMLNMPGRYAISFALSYLVFAGLVRLWAGYAQHYPARSRSDASGPSLDVPVGDGEGCLLVLGIALVSLLMVGGIWVFGGFPLLLEVVFEVAFAGTVVRGLRPNFVLGQWFWRFLEVTWLRALLIATCFVGVAALMQAKAPEANTFAQAWRDIFFVKEFRSTPTRH